MANGGVTVIIAGQDDTEKVFQAIEANLKRVQNRAGETESALSRLGTMGQRALAVFGVTVGAELAIRTLKNAVTAALDFGDAIEKAHVKTGLAVGTLSTLHFAAAMTGSDFDGLTAAVAKLDKGIGAAADGDKKSASFLTAIGLNASELVKQSDGAEVAFKRLTGAISATENPIERVRLATGLLGKAGAEQIDMLVKIGRNWDGYKKAAEDAGLSLDGTTARQLQETNEKLRMMQLRAQGAGLAFTEGLIPGINALFNTLSGGKGSMQTFEAFGNFLAYSLNEVAGIAYHAAAALEAVFALGEGGLLTKGGTTDLAASKELSDRAYQFQKNAEQIALTGHEVGWSESRAAHDMDGKKGGGGFAGTGDEAGAEKIKGAADRLRQAQADLGAEQAKLSGDRAKVQGDVELAQLEANHKLYLVSDAAYYAEKRRIEDAATASEQAALGNQKVEAIRRIGSLRPEANGGDREKALQAEAKIAEQKKKIVEIDEKMAELEAKRAKSTVETGLAEAENAKKRLAESDAIFAELEAMRGGSTGDRIQQSSNRYAERRRGLVAGGASSGDLAAADELQRSQEDTIAAHGADQTNQAQAAGFNARRSTIDSSASRGLISRMEAQRQLVALDKEEADALQPVLEAYQHLAEADGDLAAAAKVSELQTRIAELKNPVDEVAAHIREQFDSAFEGLFENLDKGSKAWVDFGKQIEKIALSEAYKSIIEPGIQQGLAAVISNGTFNGAKPTGTGQGIGSMLGGLIPGLAGKIPGATVTGGGSSSGVNVTLINQGAPMQVASAGQQQDHEAEFGGKVISVVLKDLEQGGGIAQALGIGGG